MEVSKDPGYHYCKTYLYSLHSLPGTGVGPWGTAELVVNGARGLLICQTSECINGLLAANPGTKFFVIVLNESIKENLCAGELALDTDGCRRYTWEFNTAYSGKEKQADSPFVYQVRIAAGQTSAGCQELKGVLMQGVFSLPFEVRDSRIVGFKKEGTAKKPSREAWEKNPIIQKVEPFEPPIPNTVWWQISVQPDFRYFRQAEFCPRQQSYKAVF